MGVSCASAVSSEVPRLVDTDGDGIYTGSLTLPAGHNNVITYKFGAYYPGVESIPGDNGAMDMKQVLVQIEYFISQAKHLVILHWRLLLVRITQIILGLNLWDLKSHFM